MITLSGNFCSMNGTEMELLIDLSKITAGMSTKIDPDKVRAAAEVGLNSEFRSNLYMMDLEEEARKKKEQKQTEDMIRKLMEEISNTGDEE